MLDSFGSVYAYDCSGGGDFIVADCTDRVAANGTSVDTNTFVHDEPNLKAFYRLRVQRKD